MRAGKSSPDAADDVSLDLLTGDAATDDPYRSAQAPAEDTVRDEPATASAPTQAVRQPVAKDEPTVDAYPAAGTVRAEVPAVAERPVEHAPAEERRVDESSVAHDADTVETLVAAEPQPTIPETHPSIPEAHDEDVTTELPIFAGLQQAGGHGGEQEPSGDREQAGDPDSVTTDPALELSQPFPEGEAIDGEQDVWSPPVSPTFPARTAAPRTGPASTAHPTARRPAPDDGRPTARC